VKARSYCGRRKKVLLVCPAFPIPSKRKIHHDYLPIGLLKIGTYLRHRKGYEVQVVIGNGKPDITPDEIWITSLFTYWSEYVHESAAFFRSLFPDAKIRVGGIYASLLPDAARKGTGGEVHQGVYRPAEDWCRVNGVDYSLLSDTVDFQIAHGMRGCFRRCKFCGTWKIEPKETFDFGIAGRIVKNHVVFYDNNFLRNPRINDILRELSTVRVNGKPVRFESQSGFDGRIMDHELANLLKEARFINPRIAWDNSLDDADKIHEQIQMLVKAGYKAKDIYVFMLYNWNYDFQTLEKKRLRCWEWGVQISDCRYRPLDQLFDHFNSKKRQTSRDYFIHPEWADDDVKKFRANVRKHNICVRHGFRFYSKKLELMHVSRRLARESKRMSKREIKRAFPDAWFPEDFHGLDAYQTKLECLVNESDIKSSVPQTVSA